MSGKSERAIVLVVDALELRRAGITSLVDEWARPINFETVGISPDEMLTRSQSGEDVRFVILSIGGSSLHERDLQDCAKSARELFPDAPCAIISDRKEADEAVAAARLGEQAFLSTSMEPGIARQALTFVLGGGTFFPREALLHQYAPSASFVNGQANAPKNENEALTRRQNEVLERLRLGRTNKHIARDLDMQESTVKVHVRQIMRKLGATNRTQAALFRPTVPDKDPDGAAALQSDAKSNDLRALPDGVLAAEKAGTAISATGTRLIAL